MFCSSQLISESCDIPISNNLFKQDGMSARDIGANVMRGVKLKKSANSGESSDEGEDSGISGLQEVEDGAKKKKGKSSKASKDYGDLKKASKRDLLPIEVCF